MSGSKQQTRSRRVRGWRVRRILAIVAVLALCGAAGYFAVHESRDPRFFAVADRVTGGEQTSRADIVAALNLPPDANAWLLDRRALRGRVERLPWIASARVAVRWPNKVDVAVVERRPSAIVVCGSQQGEEPAARYALIDDTQRVLAVAANPQLIGGAALPLLLVTPPPAGASPGETLADKYVTQALQAGRDLNALGVHVSEIAIAPATGISATADRHLRVLFGENEELAEKARVFQAIVAKIAQPERIAYIDVRSVRAPTVLYR